jgi:hypothetical protein
MKEFFTKKEVSEFDLSHEYINPTTRFIDYNNFRILRYHKDYTKEKEQLNDHWTNYWNSRTLYK